MKFAPEKQPGGEFIYISRPQGGRKRIQRQKRKKCEKAKMPKRMHGTGNAGGDKKSPRHRGLSHEAKMKPNL